MRFIVKRAYEKADKSDGLRVLVDRLWPRGVTKTKAKIDMWSKEVAPTGELRKWFHVNPEKRFADFSKKYKTELKSNAAAKALRNEIKKTRGTITLVTAAKEPDRSHVPTLLSYLQK